jgi:prepilin-type N-terminal cleavage/methylation domain-containing protein
MNVRRAKRHSAAGFSLIEIVLVISIIGALATVAIPGFLQFVNTSKRSETDVMFRAIHDALLDYLAQNNDRFPTDLGGGASSLTGNWNPAVFSGAKKPWLTGQPGWNLLAWEPLSYVYHSYYVYAYTSPALTYFTIEGATDLDNNGIVAYRVQQWQRYGTDWQITQDYINPANEW